jgi:hypothetical protein
MLWNSRFGSGAGGTNRPCRPRRRGQPRRTQPCLPCAAHQEQIDCVLFVVVLYGLCRVNSLPARGARQCGAPGRSSGSDAGRRRAFLCPWWGSSSSAARAPARARASECVSTPTTRGRRRETGERAPMWRPFASCDAFATRRTAQGGDNDPHCQRARHGADLQGERVAHVFVHLRQHLGDLGRADGRALSGTDSVMTTQQQRTLLVSMTSSA